ncbi:two-component system sensor histidine kinase NtrB [Neobacillus ginsengisoli]|uniref:histidine kinase n=1 Tax=Neobacillus ginsengisoli TaxID=904295 RepID=A0ABT9Y220_9BACI|nr:ATP-binding protein [Neobacillus ginsengisoli]MDQ0201874.1 PAS domain S-box-containing protein [Neobacillus ginsengisoli]
MKKGSLLTSTSPTNDLLLEKIRLETVLNSLPIGVFIINKDGEFTHMNDIVYEIWGENAFSAKNVYDYRKYIAWWEASGKQLNEDDWAASRALKGESSYGEIIKIQSFDGKLKTILNSASPIYDFEGRIEGAVVVISDITEIKRTEQELQHHKNHLTKLVSEKTLELEKLNKKLQLEIEERDRLQSQIRHLDQLNLVGQMAAGLAHEIRNPMTTIKGFLQFLQNNKEFENSKDIFNLMVDEMDRINDIISEFLNLSKNKRINKKKCCLNDIVLSISPLIEKNFILSDHNFKLNLQPNIPFAFIDENEIKQLILNLVRNGREAMSKGKTLTISTYFTDDFITLAIQDEGTGIKKELIEEISKPFFTTKPNGTGLGLPICYSIVQRHNAKIECKSTSAGTIFYVKFKPTS